MYAINTEAFKAYIKDCGTVNDLAGGEFDFATLVDKLLINNENLSREEAALMAAGRLENYIVVLEHNIMAFEALTGMRLDSHTRTFSKITSPQAKFSKRKTI